MDPYLPFGTVFNLNKLCFSVGSLPFLLGKNWCNENFQQVYTQSFNKTAGYHRHIFRLPTLVKMLFKKMKAFSFQNTLFLYQIFYFSIFEHFLTFRQKNFTIKEKTFLENIIIWYAFYHLCRFWTKSSFFRRTHLFLSKKAIFVVLRNLTTSVYYSKAICYNLVIKKIQDQSRTPTSSWTLSIGKSW